ASRMRRIGLKRTLRGLSNGPAHLPVPRYSKSSVTTVKSMGGAQTASHNTHVNVAPVAWIVYRSDAPPSLNPPPVDPAPAARWASTHHDSKRGHHDACRSNARDLPGRSGRHRPPETGRLHPRMLRLRAGVHGVRRRVPQRG